MRRALRGASARAVSGRVIAPPMQTAQGSSLPAPVGGWDAISPLANMPEDSAIELVNWYPRPDSVQIRRGNQIHVAGMGDSAIESLMVYEGLTSAASKMFAVSDGTIWDVSASGNAEAAVTSVANDRWQYVNFTTAGGKFLWACNGADTPRRFNGSSWAQTSLTSVTPSDIINVTAHKNRLWFAFIDSTKAGYLATNAVDGAVSTFELGALFTKGGYLVGMANITRDGGTGEDDFLAFFSSQGQVAVYQGTDPSSSSTWSQTGVYEIGRPLGRRCFTKLGGGLAVVNIDGVIPIPEALAVQREAVAKVAVTKKINNAVNEFARLYKANFGWELAVYPQGPMVILNVPLIEGQSQIQCVMNPLTGAWCKFSGWDANCFAVFRDELYFGANDGTVRHADTTSNDVDQVIDAQGQGAYNYYKSRGSIKNFGTARAILTTDSEVLPSIGMSTDYRDNATLGTPATAEEVTPRFDTAIFDAATFPTEGRTVSDWANIGAEGYCGSLHFRAVAGQRRLAIWGVSEWGQGQWSESLGDIDLRLNSFDVTYRKGASM